VSRYVLQGKAIQAGFRERATPPPVSACICAVH